MECYGRHGTESVGKWLSVLLHKCHYKKKFDYGMSRVEYLGALLYYHHIKSFDSNLPIPNGVFFLFFF